jgi:CSLREA domain-containing protein
MKYKSLFRSLVGVATLLSAGESLRAATFNIANEDVTALKAAIIAAGGNGQDDIVNLAVSGAYTLTAVDNSTNGDNGLPLLFTDANHTITINGNGATIQRSSAVGTPYFRILYFVCTGNNTVCGNDQKTVNDLSIVNALLANPGGTNFSGAGALFDRGNVTMNRCQFTENNSTHYGGGISNGADSLVLNNCTFTDNDSDDGGAAIVTSGNLDAFNCTFTGNDSNAGAGAAVLNFWSTASPTPTNLTNCTFYNNFRSPGGGSAGGGIANLVVDTTGGFAVAQLNLTHCTIRLSDVHNNGNYNSGIAPTGVLTIRNCILSDSTLINSTNRPDRVHITSDGYNLSTDNGGGNLTGPGDQTFTDPRLDPAGPQNNGGSTATIALLSDSPALDHGQSFGVGNDQRGQLRPRDLAFASNGPGSDGADVGAYEAVDPKQGGPTFVVNTTADHDDGTCGGVDCSLRDAVVATNAATDANTITFAASVTGTSTLNSTLGQIIVTSPVTINGPGARVLAISGGNATRVFNFGGATSVLSGLTIRDGRSSSLSSLFSAAGGGLSNYGTLTVNDCAFIGNQAIGGNNSGTDGSNGGVAIGGAVYNLFNGVITCNRCTFTGNSVTGGKGANNSGAGAFGGTGGAGQGGAIWNDATCTLAINNCTFANNTATGGLGGDNVSTNGRGGTGGTGSGAGVFNRETMTVTACTFSSNAGVGGAGGHGSVPKNDGNTGLGSGGLENSGTSSSTVRNTISAGNTGNGGVDAKGAFISQGFNLIGVADFATGFTATGDLVGTTAAPLDAKLGSLQNNGGPTDTMTLLTNSPALDQGKSFGLTTDQRNRTRPLDDPAIAPATGGDNSDIGSFESAGRLIPIRAVSRKVHRVPIFDVDLPLSGTVGIECRSGGATGDHQLIVTFPTPIVVNGSPQAQLISGTGNIGTGGSSNGGVVGINGAVVTVPLTNIANAQTITVQLNNVSDGINTNNVGIPISLLFGDINRDGFVLSGDYTAVRQKSGATVDATTFQYDVNVDGFILSGDYTAVRQQSGAHLEAHIDPTTSRSKNR